MDKIKIGNFLKELRLEKNLTQEKMVEQYSDFLGLIEVVSTATISKWERGESFPDMANLKDLSRFFNVSIDEIFNGEREVVEDFKQKYFICDHSWVNNFIPENFNEMCDLWDIYSQEDYKLINKKTNKKGVNLWAIENHQELIIDLKFKELLSKLINNNISSSEEKEFDFICEEFYYLKDDASIEDIKFRIRKQCALMHKSSFNEKYWEVYKLFEYSKKLRFYYDICDSVLTHNKIIVERIRNLEDIEKDILLAYIQRNSFYDPHGERGNEQFFKVYGIEYDIEKLTKNIIRVLIENGACLNNKLLGYYKTIKYKKDIIDTLTKGDVIFNKKILVEVLENNKYSYYLVDNTSKNRSLTGLDKIWSVDESILPNLEAKLNNGEILYETESTIWYGIEDIKDKEMEWHEDELIKESEEFINDVINDLSYDEYYNFRDEKKTQELLAELKDLDLKEIRDKYFTLEEACCE